MKMLRMVLVTVVLSVFAFACKEDEDPAPVPSVVANAGGDKKIQPGETAILDGSGSLDSEGLPLTYAWTVVQKPANSNPVLTTATIVNPTFSTDIEGNYVVELTVSSEHGSKKDNVMVTVEYNAVILTNITTRTVLEDRIANPAIPDYLVNEDIGVDAELIIKPGVVIAFAEDAAMFVNEDGSISAKGEVDRKISFKGKANEQGFWRGMLVYSNNIANEFLNAEILNAGSAVMVSDVTASITLADAARLSIKNTTIAGSGGYGVYCMDGSIITGFAANIIRNNSEAPLLLMANHVAKLDAGSSFSVGNGRNVIEVMSSFLSGNSEVTWPAFTDNTPYRFMGTVVAQTGLKLSPGITIEFVADDYFEIGDGYLFAVGTADKKIVFTGVDKTASSWKGLIVYSRSNFNVLEHVEVNYAGSTEIISGVPAGVVVTHGGSLTLKNSSISNSGGYGIYIKGSDVTINTNVEVVNEFILNAMDPVYYEE